jgi:hypothetical protein
VSIIDCVYVYSNTNIGDAVFFECVFDKRKRVEGIIKTKIILIYYTINNDSLVYSLNYLLQDRGTHTSYDKPPDFPHFSGEKKKQKPENQLENAIVKAVNAFTDTKTAASSAGPSTSFSSTIQVNYTDILL